MTKQTEETTSIGSAPTWMNWSKNLVHLPPTDGENYYFTPTSRAELQQIVTNAAAGGITLGVSGQRHSQPPLVINDNRGDVPANPRAFLVDMSCYADLGPNGDQNMVVDATNKTITVNTGVREDKVDATLTENNLILNTVTAGGFFSLGGMTAVDVHGATIDAPIFSETVSSFDIMGPDGTVTTINTQSPSASGHPPLQFVRVSLGALGIVTSMTINVLDRPYATTLKPSRETFGPLLSANLKRDFVRQYSTLLTEHDRVESFFNPYADNIVINSFLALIWDLVDPENKVPNPSSSPPSACTLAGEDKFGAPYLPIGEGIAEALALAAQCAASTIPAYGINLLAIKTIEGEVDKANDKYSDLWLANAARVIFMSYFVELPNIDEAGLEKAWSGLAVVRDFVTQHGNFHIAAPMEFRFIKGGDSALSGTYTTNPDATFINYDLIGFVKVEDDNTKGLQYTAELLQFFAHVERAWVAMGGLPHNGKMYGFYDPTDHDLDSHTTPFNPNFLKFITAERISTRQAPVQAFRDYRATRDPNGVFYNAYLRALLEP